MEREIKTASIHQPTQRAQALLITATAVALGVVVLYCSSTSSAFAQVLAPTPSPFQAPIGAPPVTSSTANGRLGAEPVAPRADELTRPTPIDAGDAKSAAARDLPAGERNAVVSDGAAAAASTTQPRNQVRVPLPTHRRPRRDW